METTLLFTLYTENFSTGLLSALMDSVVCHADL